ncbi:transposase [Streptomyces chartreusis]|uniref:transposase n=1 Tax=Streptomyces chartreusis TaxID=1969 RepID=UPI003F4D22BB
MAWWAGHVTDHGDCSPTAATTTTSTGGSSAVGASRRKIARKGNAHGSGLGRTRWVVERTFAWLHQFKRLRIRYEIRADLHLGLLQLACSIICLRRLRTSF